MDTLRDIGEFGLIQRITARLPIPDAVEVGFGDDCAVLRSGAQRWLVSCDASIEGVHFRRETASPEDIGWKASASALSDIAAMGGIPRFLLVAIACPQDTPLTFLDGLFHGMADAAEYAHAAIVGGDTTRSPAGIFLDVTVLGEPLNGKILRRAGARPRDQIAVTGFLGRSAAGFHALEQGANAPEMIQAHRRPHPRFAEGQWLAAQPAAHAMIDLSDGLLQDTGHLAEASILGANILPESIPIAHELYAAQEWLPQPPSVLALTGGEEYELIVALDPMLAEECCAEFVRQFGIPLTPIGSFTEDWAGVRLAGKPSPDTGFNHFRP